MATTATTRRTPYRRDTSFVREAVATQDTPAARLHRTGPQTVRDAELLGIIAGDPSRAHSILADHPVERIVSMGVAELRQAGLPAGAASRAAAAFELARRGLGKGVGVQPTITCPEDAEILLADIAVHRKEHFLALLLNARHQVIHRETVSIGSLSAAIVHPREVFQPAIEHNAAAVIVAHNHPSGDPTPSREDVEMTRRLVQAGEILGIEVLDHLVIAEHDFLSLKERGLM